MARPVDEAIRVWDQPLGSSHGRAYLIAGPIVKAQVVIFHGYGQSRAEGIPMALRLASLGYEIWVPDLPGHGTHPELLSSASALSLARHCLEAFPMSHAVGFSLGARLAMAFPFASAVAVSPPGSAAFEGSRSELIRLLRPRNVREQRPFSGLRETLSALGDRWDSACPTLALSGTQDLRVVRDFVQQAKRREALPQMDHHGAWWAPVTQEAIVKWLEYPHDR